MQYAIIIERTEQNYSAFVPDLPGCIATGATIDEVRAALTEAVRMHLDGLREDGDPIPAPSAIASSIETEAA